MSNQHYVNLANDVVGMINEQNEAYVPSRVSYNSSSSQASAPPVSSNASRQPNLPPARQANTSLEIIEGHDEIFDPPPNSDYECPICMMVLRNPVQTICGHRFCNGCMNQHIRLNGPKCPSDNQQLNTNEIYADNFAKREINQLNVKCRTLKNNKECPWHGPLKNLEDHLKTCEYVEIPCPKGCNQSIERRALDQHLRKDCPKRTVTCQYCKTEILQKNMKDHLGKCQKVTVTCPNCNKKMLREKLNSGHEKECPKANISCEYRNIGCKWSGQRHQVQHHLNSDMKEHLSMMNVALASLLSANGRERNRPASRAEASTSSGASSSNAADTFDRNLEEFNRLVKRNNDQINALMLRTEQIERSFRDLTARVDRQHRENEAGLTSVKNTIVDLEARMCNGVYLWRITNYPRHRENARENVVTALHSPPFYTSFYGYKLCLRINPNGVDTGYGSHVSLFVHMMQTEWDDTLEWPFSGRISLSILDQSDDGDYKRHISETLVTRPNLLAFQRPTTPRNHKGYGYVEFAHAETLQDRQYLKNDCLLIRVQVFQ